MKIEWLAHACFKIYLESGKTLLFDPFDDSIGYKFKDTTADIVMCTHGHYDHCALSQIRPGYKLVNKPGKYEYDGIKIEGLETYHDKEKGAKRGMNTMYKVEAEGLSILHMGDVGEDFSDDIYKALGEIDILMIPVGGNYTIDAEEALEICKKLEPNIIVPMHYKTLFLTLNLDPVYNFTDLAKEYFDRSRLGSSSFEITADRKKKRSRIIIMENSLGN